MDEARYQEIRLAVMKQRGEKRLRELMAEILAAPGAIPSSTIGTLYKHLDALVPPEDRPPRSPKKGQ